MTTQTYKTRTGATQYRPVLTEEEYVHSDNQGFCLACDAAKVYGLEELLMMNLLKITTGEN